MARRPLRRALLVLPALVAAALPLGTGAGAQAAGTGDTYRNPLRPRIASGGTVDSCADPTVFRGRQAGDKYWYMFCTTDPLNDQDRNAAGDFNFHKIPMMRSLDLVHWRYVGDAFADMPRIAAAGAGLWAPEVTYSTTFRKYYLFFVVTDTADAVSGEPGCTSDNAIAVATSEKPTGPWTASETPVVAPRRGGPGCNFFWTFDPDVISPSGRPDEALADNGYLYYGSYYGGIQARPLKITATGASTNEAAATQITIPNRYEAPEVVRRGSFYYLFASATNCCNGPLTGYSVFAGRSTSPLGPFVDREGVSLLAGRVGGTPVLSMNGNRWTGPGHNTVFRDFSGQWWTVYHAVNRFDPYFEGAVGFTKRPAMLDPLDWVNDWPTVRGGKWVSDRTMPAPAAQPGETTAYRPTFARPDVPGARIGALSDDFSGDTLSSQWTWVRPPAADTYGVANGRFRFNTQAGDIFQDSNTASVLTEPAPDGDYVVETRVHLNLPPEGCCYNFVQAGLVLYGHEDRFIKLTHVSIYETRQTEFAKEVPGGRTGFPRYGNTVVGPPSDWTYLRIVKRAGAAPGGEDLFTPYTSRDGRHWVRGGSYTHQLGRNERIGLVSMGGEGFVAKFDYVKVSRLR